MTSPSRKLLALAAVVLFAAVTAIAGATNTQHRPGIHNGVITTCVEPLTKGRSFGIAQWVDWTMRGLCSVLELDPQVIVSVGR